jgi:hypothetical protein
MLTCPPDRLRVMLPRRRPGPSPENKKAPQRCGAFFLAE